ncbi:MAG: hypothetical protein SGI88_11275 [Candidatus Hydrogenedentes bacterium]|nr:hypothetical protein [Candidatus Hydrogenedentota bacterium]
MIVLDEPFELANGAEVSIQIEQPSAITWAERFKDVIGIVDNLPEDMAENHNHIFMVLRSDDCGIC